MRTPKTTPQPRWRLAEARNQRGWSQQEVANRIGTTYVNISRWERGITKPGPYFRHKLCVLFGKSEQELDLEIENEEAPGRDSSRSYTDFPNAAVYDPTIPLLPAIRLVGREHELGQIRERLLAGGSVALTALNGLPGVGKTALSIALAHDQEIREHFRDGVLWAALGPQPNIAGVLSRWGTLLGLPSAEMVALNSNEEWAKSLHNAIGSRSLLLVIDDAWKLEDALIFRLGGPNCAHLVTTRFPNIASHITVDGATVIHELGEDESLTLLRVLAPDVVSLERQRVAELIQAVGGLPLALTLMGNFLRKQSYGGQPRRIRDALESLGNVEKRFDLGEPHGPIESHSSLPTHTTLSLQSVIAVTDQQLGTSASFTLYALSVFPAKPNSFSEEAARFVTACSIEDLDTLSDTGLLESSGPGRYTLHQTIYDYALLHLHDLESDALSQNEEKTEADMPWQVIHDRLIAYAIDFAGTHRKDYELLEQESATILTALDVAYELGKQAELIRAVSAFAPFLLLRGQYQLAAQHLQRAHEAATTLKDDYGLTSTLLYLGEIAQKQGRYDEAASNYQQGLDIARKLENHGRISALLTNLGWVTLKQGNYARAEVYLQEGLTLAREINNRERISGLLEMLGSVSGSRGDYAQSESYIKEGLAIARELGDRERICTMLINLGVTSADQGKDVEAEEYFQEGLELARQIGHKEWISLILINLGDVICDQGHYSQAEVYFKEGLALSREIEHREWISILLINLGLVTRKQKHYLDAERYLKEGLALATLINIPQIAANALYEYGSLYLNLQQFEPAKVAFSEMLTSIPEGGQDLLALAQYGLARTIAAQGDLQEAHKLGSLSLSVLETMGHRNEKEVRDWLYSLKN